MDKDARAWPRFQPRSTIIPRPSARSSANSAANSADKTMNESATGEEQPCRQLRRLSTNAKGNIHPSHPSRRGGHRPKPRPIQLREFCPIPLDRTRVAQAVFSPSLNFLLLTRPRARRPSTDGGHREPSSAAARFPVPSPRSHDDAGRRGLVRDRVPRVLHGSRRPDGSRGPAKRRPPPPGSRERSSRQRA